MNVVAPPNEEPRHTFLCGNILSLRFGVCDNLHVRKVNVSTVVSSSSHELLNACIAAFENKAVGLIIDVLRVLDISEEVSDLPRKTPTAEDTVNALHIGLLHIFVDSFLDGSLQQVLPLIRFFLSESGHLLLHRIHEIDPGLSGTLERTRALVNHLHIIKVVNDLFTLVNIGAPLFLFFLLCSCAES